MKNLAAFQMSARPNPELQQQADELGSREHFRDAVTFWFVVALAGVLTLSSRRRFQSKNHK